MITIITNNIATAAVAVRFPAFGFPTIIATMMRAGIRRAVRFVRDLPDLVPSLGHRDFRVDRGDPELARDMARPVSGTRVLTSSLSQDACQSDALESATAAFDFGRFKSHSVEGIFPSPLSELTGEAVHIGTCFRQTLRIAFLQELHKFFPRPGGEGPRLLVAERSGDQLDTVDLDRVALHL